METKPSPSAEIHITREGEAQALAHREKLFRDETAAFARRYEKLVEIEAIVGPSLEGKRAVPADAAKKLQQIGVEFADARAPRDPKEGGSHA